MRKITREIVNAFQNSRSLTIGNSRTDGESLWLFGNKIAEIRRDGLWITNAGWQSVTTKERLNGLDGVEIVQRNGNWYLNGFGEWDGGWVNVNAWNEGINSPSEENVHEVEFDLTSEWLPQGYSRPIYSIYHTLEATNVIPVEQILNEHGIPTRRMESDTMGIYQPNYFVVVRPEDYQNAGWLTGHLQTN